MHHVIPLGWSESIYQFKLLDKWLNMVYIDAFSHAKITQNNNRNIIMSANNNGITLQGYDGKALQLKKDENIFYNINKRDDMLNYNTELLETVE